MYFFRINNHDFVAVANLFPAFTEQSRNDCTRFWPIFNAHRFGYPLRVQYIGSFFSIIIPSRMDILAVFPAANYEQEPVYFNCPVNYFITSPVLCFHKEMRPWKKDTGNIQIVSTAEKRRVVLNLPLKKVEPGLLSIAMVNMWAYLQYALLGSNR